MTKLHEINAVLDGKKTRMTQELTKAHRWKGDLLMGMSKVYIPLKEEEDGGEVMPPSQSEEVRVRVPDVLKEICKPLMDFCDLAATQETANCKARASVEVDGKFLLKDVPIGVLLFLEKRLIDIRTFVTGIPTLPTDRKWTFDKNSNNFVSDPVEQIKTKKVPTTHVKFEPTEHQPGQAEILHVDTPVARVKTIHFSGAITAQDKAEMLIRVEQLQNAVKTARSKANGFEVEQQRIGRKILSHIFGEKTVQ